MIGLGMRFLSDLREKAEAGFSGGSDGGSTSRWTDRSMMPCLGHQLLLAKPKTFSVVDFDVNFLRKPSFGSRKLTNRLCALISAAEGEVDKVA